MNDLSKILNQRISEKIAKNQPGPDQIGQKINFDELLENKKSNLNETLTNFLDHNKTTQDVQSVPDIHLNMEGIEAAVDQPNAGSPWNTALDLFGRMNENFNSLNMALEVVSDPNMRLSPDKLIAFQIGTGQMTQEIDRDAKLVSAGVKALTRIFEMQV